jgi:hypothetical protein
MGDDTQTTVIEATPAAERGSDWRGMYDRDLIGAWDLPKEGAVVVIERVERGELRAGPGKKVDKKPIVRMRGKKKGLALNKTNGKTIAALYGNDTTLWAGKPIHIYPTTTMFGSEKVDCIRVSPKAPQAQRAPRPPATQTMHEADPADLPGGEP